MWPVGDLGNEGKGVFPESTPLNGLYRVRPQRIGFLAVLVINRESILAIVGLNRVWS